MNIKSTLEKLFSLHQFGIKLGLEQTFLLLDRIGNPHTKLKTFHIAGSNGKGSTASFIASILMEAGYKVGLYTSPHFVKFNERIRINGKMISDEYVASFVTSLEDYIDKNSPTFFEITTALAFKYFEEEKVDFAVIETGLGGRLDATNVIQPISSVITSISLEHTQHLGETIEKIASEKAGIIKPNTLVFVGRMNVHAEKVFQEKAADSNCMYFSIVDFTKKENGSVVVSLNEKSFSIYSTPLHGEHQQFNSALAVKTVCESLGINDGLVFSRGIKNVIRNTSLEGRYEIVREQPKIIFDSAHNTEGIKTFVEEFSKEYKSYSERILIFGVMKDKAISEMLAALKPYFNKIFAAQIQIDRAASIDELITIAAKEGIKVLPLADPAHFIQEYLKENKNKCLVVLGSIYLLGEIKSKMLEKRLDKVE